MYEVGARVVCWLKLRESDIMPHYNVFYDAIMFDKRCKNPQSYECRA